MSNNRDNPLIHLGFKRFEPSKKLSGFVECYWFINTDIHSPIDTKEYLHPEGGMGIILNYAEPLQFDGIAQTAPCILDGTNTLTRELGLTGVLDAVGIRFKPAGAHLLFSLPLHELKNETLALADTPLKNYPDLYSRLSHAKTLLSKVSTIEDWLCKSLQPEANTSNIVNKSLQLIKNQNGLVTIDSVAKKLDYNQRRIERLFNSQVGMTAKEYSRNLRIKTARSYIKSNKYSSFAEMAYDLGYYDQAHFINQFKNVMGITPREYFRKKAVCK
ncbi:MAG: helix-turn-helix domain-containing protein [Methyloprofundus sp.]|nr:helix-turn-helix domain-containing protein [Methyloprofundus sp.]